MANFFGNLSNLLFGSSAQAQPQPTLLPEQQQLQSKLIEQLQPVIGRLGQQSFQPFENLARQKFESQTLPSIAERFTAMGGGLRSSDLQGTLGAAGAGFESQLAGQRALFEQQNQNDLLNLLPLLLSPQAAETEIRPPQTGIISRENLQSLLPLLLSFI